MTVSLIAQNTFSLRAKKLLREDRDKKRELAAMRQSIYGASL